MPSANPALSPKAYMTVRDADLYELLLANLAHKKAPKELRVLEWGSGASTIWYTAFLDKLGCAYRWLSLEHDAQYFESEVAGALAKRTSIAVSKGYEILESDRPSLPDATITVVLFDAGKLYPFFYEKDRFADLEDYITLPRRCGYSCDLAVVDGRKRRRCLLEALHLINEDGVVLLHDAVRPYYQCAWSEYTSHRRFGDTWWIGARYDTDFSDLLPAYAFLP
jgi:hypothetical protein